MAVDGCFDMEPYTRLFGVDWTMTAYTNRDIQMTDLGRRILTEKLVSTHHPQLQGFVL